MAKAVTAFLRAVPATGTAMIGAKGRHAGFIRKFRWMMASKGISDPAS